MVKKIYNLLIIMAITMISGVVATSCSKDDEPSSGNSGSSIVGTWYLDMGDESFMDDYTLIFNKDGSGSIKNEWGTRATYQMNFDWSLTVTSSGRNLLSVIYKSGDRYIDGGPFEGGYAQYNYYVTIAGKTLSFEMEDNKVMLFERK